MLEAQTLRLRVLIMLMVYTVAEVETRFLVVFFQLLGTEIILNNSKRAGRKLNRVQLEMKSCWQAILGTTGTGKLATWDAARIS